MSAPYRDLLSQIRLTFPQPVSDLLAHNDYKRRGYQYLPARTPPTERSA